MEINSCHFTFTEFCTVIKIRKYACKRIIVGKSLPDNVSNKSRERLVRDKVTLFSLTRAYFQTVLERDRLKLFRHSLRSLPFGYFALITVEYVGTRDIQIRLHRTQQKRYNILYRNKSLYIALALAELRLCVIYLKMVASRT